ncbi:MULTISPECIES: hypothetical protein [unclassified Pseudomonas]|uniref:hypothetical protein n=1 Tax=unclassified Pseudomonas TaxID=196821 RepID=UPI002115877A|nr:MULTISPECIES: hypothetical protein [unclassified Pseudomonas]
MAKLTINIEADSPDQISTLLDMALRELKRQSGKNEREFTQSMVGHQTGTVGTYTVEYAAPAQYDWAKDLDLDDPFGFNDVDKPKTPKPIEGYTHPSGWVTDAVLLINDPNQPLLTEGRLFDYMSQIRGRHIYLLLTELGVATVASDYLQLKPNQD